MFYPIVQFYAEDGKLMQERLAVGTNVSFHKKGQSIKVVYYDGLVYPRGLGWKLLNWSFFLSGLGATVYQIYYW